MRWLCFSVNLFVWVVVGVGVPILRLLFAIEFIYLLFCAGCYVFAVLGYVIIVLYDVMYILLFGVGVYFLVWFVIWLLFCLCCRVVCRFVFEFTAGLGRIVW